MDETCPHCGGLIAMHQTEGRRACLELLWQQQELLQAELDAHEERVKHLMADLLEGPYDEP